MNTQVLKAKKLGGPKQGQDLREVKIPPSIKLRRFWELKKAADNEHGIGYVRNRDGSAVIVFASVDKKDVVTVPTRITQAQFRQVLDKILPIPESQAMLFDLATVYAMRAPCILVGGTAIGKTFTVNRFAEFLYGPNAKIPDFYCNGQTDVSELMGKFVPAGLGPQQLQLMHDYLRSDAGAALKAEMQQVGGFSTQDLLERAALELKLPIQKGSFVFQLGVLPRAMTGTMSPEGVMIDTPDGAGCMLHIQEVGMAAPGVINALLQIRGEKGKLAVDIQVHEDGGRLIKAGPEFFLVFSTNPPGVGFKERFEVDPALARGLVWKTLPDRLSPESMAKVASRIFDCSKVTRRVEAPGAIIDLRRHRELAELLGSTALKFHQLYLETLEDGEPGCKQKIPVTIDSLWKVAEILQNQQLPNDTFSGVDFIATLRSAIQGIYIDALRDKPGRFGGHSLEDAAKHRSSLGAELMIQLENILINEQLEEISFESKTMTRKVAIEILASRAMAGGGKDPVDEVPDEFDSDADRVVDSVADEIEFAAAIRDLETILGPAQFNSFGAAIGLNESGKNGNRALQ